MKIVLIGAALIAILAALGAAGLFMLRGGKDTSDERKRMMARALAVRVGLSILLFVCILLAWEFGWIEPTGLPIAR